MVGNFVLRRRVSGAVKRNFRPYNRWYTSPHEHFEYGYPHSNALFKIYSSKAQHFAPNWNFVSNVKQLRQPITSDVTYDVGAHRRIYWRKFWTLSNQTSRYIRKCIRIPIQIISRVTHSFERFCVFTHVQTACRMPDSSWCARLMPNCVFSECSKIDSKLLNDKNIIAILGWSVRTLAQYTNDDLKIMWLWVRTPCFRSNSC